MTFLEKESAKSTQNHQMCPPHDKAMLTTTSFHKARYCNCWPQRLVLSDVETVRQSHVFPRKMYLFLAKKWYLNNSGRSSVLGYISKNYFVIFFFLLNTMMSYAYHEFTAQRYMNYMYRLCFIYICACLYDRLFTSLLITKLKMK